jgi:hypothetical protein
MKGMRDLKSSCGKQSIRVPLPTRVLSNEPAKRLKELMELREQGMLTDELVRQLMEPE